MRLTLIVQLSIDDVNLMDVWVTLFYLLMLGGITIDGMDSHGIISIL